MNTEAASEQTKYTRGVAILPAQLVELLLQIAMRTETGSAFMLGFREAHPELSGLNGNIEITVRDEAVIRVIPLQ